MYEVNTSSLDKCKNDNKGKIIGIIVFIIILLVPTIFVIKQEGFSYYVYIGLVVIPIYLFIFIYSLIKNITKVKKKYKDIEYLKNNGKLIKKVPYVLKRSNVKRGNPTKRLKIIVMHYTLPTGITLTLESEPRDDSFTIPKEGFADLLIDEDNPDRYFIDMNINRIGGNKEEDFYKEQK